MIINESDRITDLDKLKSLDTDKMTMYQISKAVGRTIVWTRNRLLEHGLPYSKSTRGVKKKEHIKKIMGMETEKMNTSEIAKCLGLSDGYVRSILKELSIYKNFV